MARAAKGSAYNPTVRNWKLACRSMAMDLGWRCASSRTVPAIATSCAWSRKQQIPSCRRAPLLLLESCRCATPTAVHQMQPQGFEALESKRGWERRKAAAAVAADRKRSSCRHLETKWRWRPGTPATTPHRPWWSCSRTLANTVSCNLQSSLQKPAAIQCTPSLPQTLPETHELQCGRNWLDLWSTECSKVRRPLKFSSPQDDDDDDDDVVRLQQSPIIQATTTSSMQITYKKESI